MELKVVRLVSTTLRSNVYFVFKGKDAVIIDAGYCDFNKISELITENELKVQGIFLTHAHIDHMTGLNFLKEMTGAKVYQHKSELDYMTNSSLNRSVNFNFKNGISLKPGDVPLEGNETIDLGDITVKVLHTPGHSPGGLCYKIDDCVFTGDTLFRMAIGHTKFPYASYEQEVENIKSKLFALPDETIIYPGHGRQTIIGEEKRNNPLMRL